MRKCVSLGFAGLFLTGRPVSLLSSGGSGCSRSGILLCVCFQHFHLLCRNPLLPATTGFLVLGSPLFRLVRQLLGSDLFRLLPVDVLHEDALVLEHVSLRLHVQVVIEVTVDLFVGPVLFQQPAQDPQPPDPRDLDRHPGVGCPFPLSRPCVATLSTGFRILPDPGTGVDGYRFLDDEPIFHQLTHMLPAVCIPDLVRLIGIQPDLVFAAFEDGSGQSFLQPQGTSGREKIGESVGRRETIVKAGTS